ncbi:hypothetical protein ACN26Z_03330 [Verrucosispora sp. WMMD703]|uniref:hypothetical protein n=1 Tax=Micromonospora TaxID=1873 RepID=UPI0037A33910
MEHETSDGPTGRSPEAPARSRDLASLTADIFTAAAGFVGVVQALRAGPLWALWVALGTLALAGLLAYRLRQRRWRAAAVSLTVLLLLGGGGALLALTGGGVEQPADTPAGAAPDDVSPTTASRSPSSDPTSGPRTGDSAEPVVDDAGTVVFSDVVQLDKQTGVDLDDGRAERRYVQDATVDLYLDWGYVLYGSARHSQLHDDSNAGPEQGARDRCRTYRVAGRDGATSTYIGGGNQQKCFTTSQGRPGWVQAVNSVGNGGLLLKVTVWAD